MLPRVVSPEILDSLPHDDPRSVASRRDLRRINALMGNCRWIANVLRTHIIPGSSVGELGAGDGQLAGQLAIEMPFLRGKYTALDLAPAPAGWPDGFNWLQANLWSTEGEQAVRGAGIVIANLFLHHLDDAGLARLGSWLGTASLLVFNEGCRRRLHLWEGALISPFLGPVTRHDMFVSIHASFRDDELARLLGLGPDWHWQVHTTLLGAYRFIAQRQATRD
jgi:hypothetical protein